MLTSPAKPTAFPAKIPVKPPAAPATSPASFELLGAGVPAFGFVPPSLSWWPQSAPWRVCHEGAAAVAAAATRRVLRVTSVSVAVELLSPTTPANRLFEMARSGVLLGLDGCGGGAININIDIDR